MQLVRSQIMSSVHEESFDGRGKRRSGTDRQKRSACTPCSSSNKNNYDAHTPRNELQKHSTNRRDRSRQRRHSEGSSDSSNDDRKRRRMDDVKRRRRRRRRDESDGSESDARSDSRQRAKKRHRKPKKKTKRKDRSREHVKSNNVDDDRTVEKKVYDNGIIRCQEEAEEAQPRVWQKKQEVAEQARKSQQMVPMSREQYEAQQAQIRHVYDEASGRMRLVRGTGEIIESLVSRSQHVAINQQATRGDGSSFARSIYHAASGTR